MTTTQGLNMGLGNFGQTLLDYIPAWMKDGLNKRKRGQLGFRLMAAHKSGADHHSLCDKIASFKRATGLAKFGAPREHAGDKSKTHNILTQTTYIAPTLALGLCMTFAFNAAGLITQVADTMRLDSGQAFLCALEDHGINLENAQEIKAALCEPEITKDLYANAAKSGAIEAGFGFASVGVGNALGVFGPSIMEAIPVQQISDNLAQSAARLFPNFSQVAIKTAAREATVSAANGIVSAIAMAGDKVVDKAGSVWKGSLTKGSKHRVDDAMRGKNPEKAAAIFRTRAVNSQIHRSVHLDYVGDANSHPIWTQGHINSARIMSEDEERELGFDIAPAPILEMEKRRNANAPTLTA